MPPSKVVPPLAKSADEQELSKRSSDLDRQLLRDLLPDLPLDLELPVDKSGKPGPEQLTSRSRLPLADELDETVEAMREVSRRLDNKSLTEETEKLQTSIVSNIDLLIEKLQNRPLPGPPPSSDSSDENPQQDQQPGPQPQPQNTQQNQPGADSASRPGERPQAGKAGESTEQNLRQAQERAAALARRRALIDEVWGHLPPAMRERLLNVGSETLLPRYEEMIRRYYEALAEPERSDSRR
ncbi:MAG: hypothetical protein O3B86_18330 [Planctomycetota bacterium]|nr:hypothetical protein [Planctomycetota bacterium]